MPSGDARGLAATLGAFLIWGLSPLFWKLLVSIPATQLLAHRVLWAAAILWAYLAFRRRLDEVPRAVSSPRVAATLVVTTALICTNWLTYIWAVITERILQASLGYYINPLVTVLLGVIFLSERLDRAQRLSLLLAGAGVGILVWRHGTLPWIALVLASTFGLYSLLRKQVQAEADVGLLVETGLLTPIVAVFLVRVDFLGAGAFGRLSPGTDLLLVGSGLVTALPLFLFTYGARRLSLTTVGFIQFSAPTLQFLLAVLVFDEPFTRTHLFAFISIWSALGVFSWNAYRSRNRPREARI